MESAFPRELGGMFRKLESKGNPWGLAPRKRMDWAKGLDFEVPVIGVDVEDASEVDYLFWVGCAGAYEDRAKRTTRAVAELLHTAGVSFAVLGDAETCTGDPARRAGNEILYQMLAGQNVETLTEAKVQRIVVTCAHCFNTISREYPQIGGRFEVLHHTQLLSRLVREGRLKPVAPQAGAGAAGPERAADAGPAGRLRALAAERAVFSANHTQAPAYTRQILSGVADPLTEVDETIATYAQGWALARMPAVDRAIARVATWEIVWNDDVDAPVAVDEAITLARMLSTDDSPRYLSGLLGRIGDLPDTLR